MRSYLLATCVVAGATILAGCQRAPTVAELEANPDLLLQTAKQCASESQAGSQHKSPDSCTNAVEAERNVAGSMGAAFIAADMVSNTIKESIDYAWTATGNNMKAKGSSPAMPTSNAEFSKMWAKADPDSPWSGKLTLRGFEKPFGDVVIGPKSGQITARFTTGPLNGKQITYLSTATVDNQQGVSVCVTLDKALTTVPDGYFKGRGGPRSTC